MYVTNHDVRSIHSTTLSLTRGRAAVRDRGPLPDQPLQELGRVVRRARVGDADGDKAVYVCVHKM